MADIKIPDYWTPEQATVVFELVEDLREAILERYQLQIMEKIHSERLTDFEPIEPFDVPDVPF